MRKVAELPVGNTVLADRKREMGRLFLLLLGLKRNGRTLESILVLFENRPKKELCLEQWRGKPRAWGRICRRFDVASLEQPPTRLLAVCKNQMPSLSKLFANILLLAAKSLQIHSPCPGSFITNALRPSTAETVPIHHLAVQPWFLNSLLNTVKKY